MDLTLGIVEAAFLTVAVISPMRVVYFFYLEIWYRICHGQDPWFTVLGQNGLAPLNACGPLFDPLAGLVWINPVAPRLLFSYAYILFAISKYRGFAAVRPPSGMRAMELLALFWNPFPWIEVASYGHFDILIGLSCLGVVQAWAKGWDIRSGACLAAGALPKSGLRPDGMWPPWRWGADRPRSVRRPKSEGSRPRRDQRQRGPSTRHPPASLSTTAAHSRRWSRARLTSSHRPLRPGEARSSGYKTAAQARSGCSFKRVSAGYSARC